MKPVLLILDDWEGLIAKNPCWSQIKELVDIRFLSNPITKATEAELKGVNFLMALRERTALTGQWKKYLMSFRKLPVLNCSNICKVRCLHQNCWCQPYKHANKS